MPRSIDYIYMVVAPVTSSSSCCYSNTALLFLLHPIHHCCPFIHTPNFIGVSRVIKNHLRSCRLASIYMGNNPYISYLLQRKSSWHLFILYFEHCFHCSSLPAKMSESLVSLGHFMSVLTLLNCCSSALHSIN